MTTITRSITGTALAAAVIAVSVLSAPTASANDDDVIRRGSCSGATDWKLKASPEDGRIEVEGEVDSNRNGQTWRWRILHDGKVSARGTATTRGRSGSFDVERRVVNSRGKDLIGWRAVNTRSGEVCRGSLRY